MLRVACFFLLFLLRRLLLLIASHFLLLASSCFCSSCSFFCLLASCCFFFPSCFFSAWFFVVLACCFFFLSSQPYLSSNLLLCEGVIVPAAAAAAIALSFSYTLSGCSAELFFFSASRINIASELTSFIIVFRSSSTEKRKKKKREKKERKPSKITTTLKGFRSFLRVPSHRSERTSPACVRERSLSRLVNEVSEERLPCKTKETSDEPKRKFSSRVFSSSSEFLYFLALCLSLPLLFLPFPPLAFHRFFSTLLPFPCLLSPSLPFPSISLSSAFLLFCFFSYMCIRKSGKDFARCYNASLHNLHRLQQALIRQRKFRRRSSHHHRREDHRNQIPKKNRRIEKALYSFFFLPSFLLVLRIHAFDATEELNEIPKQTKMVVGKKTEQLLQLRTIAYDVIMSRHRRRVSDDVIQVTFGRFPCHQLRKERMAKQGVGKATQELFQQRNQVRRRDLHREDRGG